MSLQIKLHVTDKEKWCKEFVVEKSIIHIGSAMGNDVVLDPIRGKGVSPRHVQVIAPSDGSRIYRLVNLGTGPITLVSAGGISIDPPNVAQVQDEDVIEVGEFSFTLQGSENGLSAPVGPEGSANIGLRVFVKQAEVAGEYPAEGMIVVRNQGQQTGVQFKLEVVGLEPECYDIGPVPILFPGVQREIPWRIYHSVNKKPLLAGERSFMVRATAPESYPNEMAEVSQTIRVLPFYRHTLRLAGIAQ